MATVTTAGKLTRRNGRKRNKINAIEKVMALKSLMDNPTNENLDIFRRKYVASNKKLADTDDVSYKHSILRSTLKRLSNLASKSMAWKFEIFCDYFKLVQNGNRTGELAQEQVIFKLGKQEDLSTSVLETRFVNPNRIERYDDKSRKKINNMGRL